MDLEFWSRPIYQPLDKMPLTPLSVFYLVDDGIWLRRFLYPAEIVDEIAHCPFKVFEVFKLMVINFG